MKTHTKQHRSKNCRCYHKKLPDGRWITIRPCPYRIYWPTLERLRPSPHWPDRSAPFDPVRSEVIGFIVTEFHVSIATARRIFTAANQQGVIVFNAETRLWTGCKAARP